MQRLESFWGGQKCSLGDTWPYKEMFAWFRDTLAKVQEHSRVAQTAADLWKLLSWPNKVILFETDIAMGAIKASSPKKVYLSLELTPLTNTTKKTSYPQNPTRCVTKTQPLWSLTMALACARLDLPEMMPQGLSSLQLLAAQGIR